MSANRGVALPTINKSEGIFAKLEAAADAAHLRSFAPTELGEALTNRVAYLINRCIEAAVDTQKVHALAATSVRNPKLRNLLHDRAKRRGGMVAELQALLGSMGRFPENEGTTSGLLRRGVMDARILLGAAADHALVMDCVHADVRALATYKDAWEEIVERKLPKGIETLVASHRDVLFAEHTELARGVP